MCGSEVEGVNLQLAHGDYRNVSARDSDPDFVRLPAVSLCSLVMAVKFKRAVPQLTIFSSPTLLYDLFFVK